MKDILDNLMKTVTRPFTSVMGRRPVRSRSRGRTNRLRRFGPHTTMIRHRLKDLETLQQAAHGRLA